MKGLGIAVICSSSSTKYTIANLKPTIIDFRSKKQAFLKIFSENFSPQPIIFEANFI